MRQIGIAKGVIAAMAAAHRNRKLKSAKTSISGSEKQRESETGVALKAAKIEEKKNENSAANGEKKYQ
jgi:hypothetical protein